MTELYPFSAIVGQERLKQALLVCAVNPAVGGLLIRGDKGTAKSTAARGLSELLAPIERTVGCAFNCLPNESPEWCSVCSQPERQVQPGRVPFVNLPLGASEDRVLGSLDFEKALQEGKRALQPGLLATANRGILYIDEVNLLADHLVDVLLDVAAMGVNTLQREGLSVSHPAAITLIGTMNLEEGDLRPQLLDRFGMMVDIVAPSEPSERAEVVRRRIAYENSPEAFSRKWQAEQEASGNQVQNAQRLLPAVEISEAYIDLISQICCQLQAVSLRADIVMHKVARTFAALDGRKQVGRQDIKAAAELVLPHRRRRSPMDKAALDKELLDQILDQAKTNQTKMNQRHLPTDDRSSDPDDQSDPDQDAHETAEQDREGPSRKSDVDANGDEQKIFQPIAVATTKALRLKDFSLNALAGRCATISDVDSGRFIKAMRNENPKSIAVEATLRHSVVRNGGKLKVEPDDLHEKVHTRQSACLILFAVDTSGSMSARKRMELVKGCIMSLLQDAYEKRDRVAVISFAGADAVLSLPPTRSTDLAQQKLSTLPTGGRTPLAQALALALATIKTSGKKYGAPLLVLLTDGKANVPINDDTDPWRESLQIAAEINSQGVATVVVDTESGFVRLGKTRELAEVLGAHYLTLESLTADQLTMTIHNRLGKQ